MKRFLACCLIMLLFLSGCGGGGGGDSASDDTTNNDSNATDTYSNLVVDDDIAALEITEVSMNENGDFSLSTTQNSSLSDNLEIDSVITVVPNVDDRFPFGVSGKVAGVTTDSDGSVTYTLDKASLADVVDSTYQEESVGLNADNFIGVIAPSATQATEEASAAYNNLSAAVYSDTKYAINGGVVVRNNKNLFALSQGVATPTILGGVALNLKAKLSDMGVDIKGLPDDTAFTITGSLDNLVLDHTIDFDSSSGLNELEMILNGEINIDVNLSFNETGSIFLGYSSKAWKEVADAQMKLLGMSGKLTGLDEKDKAGKFPLVGLAWSIPSSTLYTSTIGETKTPVNLAKPAGVIVWVYLDAEGTITLEGEFGSRINSAGFSVGVEKLENGTLNPICSIYNTGDERLLELPYIDGSLGFEASAGISLEVDAFTLGVRLANASAELIGKFSTELEGSLSYGTYELDEDWTWEGNACFTKNYGAGLILSTSVDIGVEIDTGIWEWTWDGISYHGQWPSEEDIETPGWHGIGDSTWYTADSTYICFPDPDEVVNILDSNLEAAIRDQIGKPTGTITAADMMEITSLISDFNPPGGPPGSSEQTTDPEEQINNIEGLEYCSNLESLLLIGHAITDISPLAGMPNLTELNLTANQISDITPLSGLTNLNTLTLHINQISDISPLAGLTNLEVLGLGDNQISDISSLAELTNLEELVLGDNPISDISALAGFTNLTGLILGGTQVDDLSILSGMTNLNTLFLHNNQISDVSLLAGLTNLEELGLSSNQISDISPLSGLTNLTLLMLDINQISDISPLESLTNIEMLWLADNGISDISALVYNTGIDSGDLVNIGTNMLSTNSCEVLIPELESRGVTVFHDCGD